MGSLIELTAKVDQEKSYMAPNLLSAQGPPLGNVPPPAMKPARTDASALSNTFVYVSCVHCNVR